MGVLDADLVLVDGKVVTVDSEDSIVEAVAVRDGRIVAVGDSSDVMGLAGDGTRVVDLGGRTVLPGIIDSHTHPSGAAVRFLEIDCRSPPCGEHRGDTGYGGREGSGGGSREVDPGGEL